ncbi:MAG: D-alanyl-D-alanine carboxypeptidase family protein, partial [Brevundimonas sp.]|nr:D-alanyl-D-alanine carboxypeptidase family protein [Brevundimonas sp.]
MRLTELLRRGWLSLVLVAVMVATPVSAPVMGAQAQTNPRYAAIVVDAETGEVLFARYADNRRYPASLTKIMTLYLTFEALEAGRVRLDDMLTVSPRAATQEPSKLGLGAGDRISLEDAMKATAVISANDMAVSVAEHVAGSEARMAAQMTLKARELGMTQTRFVNVNGMPDARQLSSARDVAILARAVMRDYPQYYRFFGLHDFEFRGSTRRNTNALLRGGGGYDGMKTGTTNASGSNLVVSAVRDGKRIITVVLGGQRSASRNAHVAALTDTGFEVVRLRRQGERIQVAQTFFEQRGFGNTPDDTLPPGSAPVQYAQLNDDDEEASITAILNAGASSAPPAAAPPARTPARTPPRAAPAPA